MATPDKGGRVPPKRGRASRGRIPFWLRLCALTIRPAAWLLWKLDYRGMTNIPVDGPVILVLNHISPVDPLLIARYVWDSGRVPRFLIKDTLWKVPVVRRAMVGTEQIPVSRGSTSATDSLAAAEASLRRGQVLCVYPEGTVTRDPDFWPMQPRTGVARLALAFPDVPVIPIAQWGAHRTLDYHTKKRDLFPRKPTAVEAGPPIDLSAHHGQPVTADLLRRVSDECLLVVQRQLAAIRGETEPAALYDPVAVARARRVAERAAEQTDAEQADAEQTDAEQTDAEQTDDAGPGTDPVDPERSA